MNYLDKLTVKALREIAAQMNVKLLSRDRKAAIVAILTNHIEAAHEVALMADETYAEFRKLAALDFPAVEGGVVTEAHAKICADKGHATYVKDGMDTGLCARCGEVTTSEEQITDEQIKGIDSEEIVEEPYAAEIEMLTNGINTLLPLEAAYRTNYQVAKNGTDSTRTDLAYQMWQDAVDAIAELRQTLEYVYTEAQNA